MLASQHAKHEPAASRCQSQFATMEYMQGFRVALEEKTIMMNGIAATFGEMLVTNLYFQTPMSTVTVPSPGVLLCVTVESTNDAANWSSVTRRPRPWPRFTHSALRRLLVDVRISEEKFP